MAKKKNYLGPLHWSKEAQAWGAPAGAVVIDFRTLEQQSIAGGEPQGVTLIASEEDLPSEYALLGEGDGELKVSGRMRSAWESLTGFAAEGETLADLVQDHLTRGADAEGLAACLPLMPTTELQMEVWLSGKARREAFSMGHAHGEKVRAMLQREFKSHFDEFAGKSETHLKVLDYWCEKYDLRGEEDWKLLVPSHLLEDVPGRVKHETTITESFNTADSDTLGPDLSWTEISTDWDIVSNRCRHMSAGSTGIARANSDLSSVDHYAQADIVTAGTGGESAGVICRKDSTATLTYYCALKSTNASLLRKRVAGTFTTLRTDAISVSLPDTIKVLANGSSIEHFWNGVSMGISTDTAITTGLRCGLNCFRENWDFDNFEAGDLAVTVAAARRGLLLRRRRDRR